MKSLKAIQKGLVSKNYKSETLSDNGITIQSSANPLAKKFSGIINKEGGNLGITVFESNYSPKYLKNKLVKDIKEFVPEFSVQDLNFLSIGPGSVVTVESGPIPPKNRQFSGGDRFHDNGSGLISCNGLFFGRDFQGTLQGGSFTAGCEGGTNQRTYANYLLS